MTYYALKDSDWAFDDQDEGRAIIVQADAPEEAISKATEMHIQQHPGAGGVTWDVARLDLVGVGDAEWDDDNQPKFEAFRFYEEGLNEPSETYKRIKTLEADNAAMTARVKEFVEYEQEAEGAKELYLGQIEALEAKLAAAEKALEPFALISSEGVIKQESGHVTVITCAEYFHNARAVLVGKP